MYKPESRSVEINSHFHFNYTLLALLHYTNNLKHVITLYYLGYMLLTISYLSITLLPLLHYTNNLKHIITTLLPPLHLLTISNISLLSPTSATCYWQIQTCDYILLPLLHITNNHICVNNSPSLLHYITISNMLLHTPTSATCYWQSKHFITLSCLCYILLAISSMSLLSYLCYKLLRISSMSLHASSSATGY